MALNNFRLWILCGFSNTQLLLSYIDKLYRNVGQKYWLRRTRFDACGGVIISVNFAHVRHLHMFGVCHSQVFGYASLFFTFTSLGTFSILCLTTDVSTKVMRKKSVTSARSPRNTSAQPGDLYGVTSRWLYENTAQPGDRYGVTSRWLYEKTNLAASNMLRA